MQNIDAEMAALWAEVQAVGREYGCADRHEPSESNKKVLERYVRAVLEAHDTWVPSRWWRVNLSEDGSLWAESSDEQECRRIVAKRPKAFTLQRMYVTHEHSEWRDVE